ncbi:uncharacterized protein LOC128240218 [Mya arenaria]|uniref:uncharacterized protein LOC128240218 n=1 Tax=Mya arenaria TaxID=6604 RepID=UPI0022E94985|nr:uncharacterized protein LOC128240218 [Mya arenaria]
MLRQARVLFLLVSMVIAGIEGHGYMMEPPQRSSAWRYRNDPDGILQKNYNDMGLNCGGREHQHSLGGKCGVCGDPFDQEIQPNHYVHPTDPSKNGKYVTGFIVNEYEMNSEIDVIVKITAHHKGYFEFRLCPLPGDGQRYPVTQECLDKYPLKVGDSYKYNLPNLGAGDYLVNVKLPDDISCNFCVLQWIWVGGNSHGYQENFWNCADIRIIGGESNPATTKPTTQAPPPTTAAPTTNPAAPVDTTLCRAIGIFAGVDEMDEFCRKQCSIPESCHTNLCDCSPPTTMPYCVPISEMLNVTVCEVLCLEDMAFCDNEFCYCIFGQETKTTKPATTTTTTTTTTPTTTTTTTTPAPNAVGDRTCKSVRPNDPGMDRWCEWNCHHTPPYCPPTHCKC